MIWQWIRLKSRFYLAVGIAGNRIYEWAIRKNGELIEEVER